MDPIYVECRLTERQYRDYMKYHVLGNKKDLCSHIMISVLILLFGLANFRTGSSLLGWIFLSLSVYFFISRFLRFYMSVNRITEQYGLGSEPKYFYSVSFDENGLHVKNLTEKADYKWENICRACYMENKNIIYLYLTKSAAFLLPFEGFSEGTPKDLIDQVQIRCGSEKTILHS